MVGHSIQKGMKRLPDNPLVLRSSIMDAVSFISIIRICGSAMMTPVSIFSKMKFLVTGTRSKRLNLLIPMVVMMIDTVKSGELYQKVNDLQGIEGTEGDNQG